MPVTLENVTRRPRRMVTLNLTKESSPVKVTRLTQARTRQGSLGTKIESIIVPGSVHIASGERSKPLPSNVVDSPEVKAAITKKWIKVHTLSDKEPSIVEKSIEVSPTPTAKEGDFTVTEEGVPSSKTSTKGNASKSSQKKKR